MIEKVEVRIGEQTVSVTLEQLRELWKGLDELFGKKESVPCVTTPVYIPIRERTWPDPYYWEVTCSDSTKVGISYNSSAICQGRSDNV
jgi:hypothetical protein